MGWGWGLLALLALAGPGRCGPPLLPFGSEGGDAELEAGDDVTSPALELSAPLHFYGSAVHSVHVSRSLRGSSARASQLWGGLRGTAVAPCFPALPSCLASFFFLLLPFLPPSLSKREMFKSSRSFTTSRPQVSGCNDFLGRLPEWQ